MHGIIVIIIAIRAKQINPEMSGKNKDTATITSPPANHSLPASK